MGGASAMGEQLKIVLGIGIAPDERDALCAAADEGFRFAYADSAEEALRRAAVSAPDVVLCDMAAPGAEGILERLRGDGIPSGFSIFALVPEGDEDAQVDALERGADGVISLPIDPRFVRARIKSALRNRSAAEARLQEINDQLRFLNEASRFLLVGTDPDNSIRLALEKVRDYFEGDRTYVFELDDERALASNTYEHCSPGVRSEQQNLQKLPRAVYRRILGILETGESICLEGIEAVLGSGLDENGILTSQGIEGIILVPLRTEEGLVGFMGVDNPKRNASHASHLAALGDYMTAILRRRDDEQQILRDNRVLRDLMKDMPGGFVQQIVTPDGRTIPQFINEEFCRMSGMSHDECVEFYSTDGFTGVHPDDNEMAKEALGALIATRETLTLRLRLVRGDGGYVPMQVFYRVTDDRDGNLLLSGYYTDLTEQLASEEREMAEHDELTGLFNRTKLARMRDGAYLGLSSCGVLFFDVNRLKVVNDTLGHEHGDVMLRLVADGIRAIADDRVHGYRYGGDEFIVVACDGEEEELAELAQRWRMAAHRLSEDREVVATASIGSAWGRAPFTLGDLIRRADQAMYDEKRRMRRDIG